MKRFFIITLLILFLSSMFIPLIGSANTGGLTFSIGTVSAARGGPVSVPINISNNTAGFAAVGLVVSYEADKLSFVSVVPSFTELPTQPVTVSTERVGDRIFQWVLFADVVDMTKGFDRNDVTIGNLNFLISPTAAIGTSFIDLSWTPAPREGSPVSLNASHIIGAQAFGGNLNITATSGGGVDPTPTPPPPPEGQYQLRVMGVGSGGTQTGNHLPTTRVTLNAGTPPTGQTFVNWTIVPTTVSLTSPTSATAAQVTMPTAVPTATNNIITVTANWSGGGFGGGGGGGSGGGGSGGGGEGGSADGTITVLSHFGTFTGSGTRAARVDEDDSKFVRLLLSGNVVASSNYTVTAGSTIITLNEAYLNNFANGTYTFRAEFTDGFANLTLIVSRNFGVVPQTGVPSITGTMITMWMSIFMTAVLGVCLYTYIRSIRKQKGYRSDHEK